MQIFPLFCVYGGFQKEENDKNNSEVYEVGGQDLVKRDLETHSIRLEGMAPNFDWTVTDIDQILDSNPYLDSSRKTASS